MKRRLNTHKEFLLGLCLALFTVQASQAAETKGFVVSLFVPAMNSQEGDCPQGQNPSPDGFLREIAAEQGISSAEVDKMIEEEGWRPTFYKLAANRGRINGEPANAYLYPWSTPDPKIKTVVNDYGLGFNLDGQVDENDFIDPLTNEEGVDNELFRILGCFERLRGSPGKGSAGYVLQWNGVREGMSAWLVEVSDINDMQNDDDVTVRIMRAQGPIIRKAGGDVLALDLQSHVTYTAKPDPRTDGNVFKGAIKDGVFVSNEPIDFYMIADSYVQPEIKMQDTRLRITFRPDGSAVSYLGGFMNWLQTWTVYAQSGPFTESTGAVDSAGIWHAFRRMADGPVNPETGKRDHISAAWEMIMVPAFISWPDEPTQNASLTQ